jgi:hypothetical protein
MGIFRNIRNYFNEKRLTRLESDLMTLSSRNIQFNPKHITNVDYIDPQREFTLRTQENLIWFIGKARLIRQFYATNVDMSQDLSFFWREAPINYPKKHSGLPNTVSNKMGTILFGGGFDNDVEIYKVDADGKATDELDKEKSKIAKETLEILKDKCKYADFCRDGSVTESWSGHLFAKFSYDLKLSEYPILETADIRNAEIEKVRGITKSITFKNYFKYGNDNCVHKETYTTNTEGDAMIINRVYKISQSGEEMVPLEILAKALGVVVEPEFTFKGVKGMLAFEKPNKLPNSEFLDSFYGESDYNGGIPAFDGLDEVLSEIFAEIRNNKVIRYIPDTFLQYTEDGDLVGINKFVTNYIKVTASMDQNAKNEINITEIKDKMESLQKKWQIGIATACTKMGISPVALGIPGLESIAAAADSQQERNKATLETRSAKLKLWKPFVENQLLMLLSLNSWMQKQFPSIQDGVDRIDVDFANCNVNVKFGDYIVDKQSEKIATWGSAKTQRVASTREAVKNIHPDWDDAKIDEEVNLIRFEEGMSLDNPNNLPELTGKENEDEEDDNQGEGGSVDDMTNEIEKKKQQKEQETE